MDYAVKIENVSKTYFLYNKPSDRLKEALSITRKSYHRDFHALSPLSLEIPKGGCFGIIGVNGSGKSTLLKMITGVLHPTTGNIDIHGRVSALLELGAGFNMEYTGIENVYLNGTVMGYSKAEMDARLPDILAFADIGDFVNQPVKTYSSGMFARLAFAVAINVDPDILIVDEALSVGDIYFQSKCFKKFDEFKASGKTIIFVTHDMGSVLRYCDSVMVLNKGEKVGIGNPHDMVDLYKKILANQYVEEAEKKEEAEAPKEEKAPVVNWKSHMALNPKPVEYGEKKIEIIDFGIFDHKGQLSNTVMKGQEFDFKVAFKFHEAAKDVISTLTIKTMKGESLCGTNTFLENVSISGEAGDVYEVRFRQKCTLQPGQYLISTSITKYVGEEVFVFHRLYDVVSLDVIGTKSTVGFFDPESKVELVKR